MSLFDTLIFQEYIQPPPPQRSQTAKKEPRLATPPSPGPKGRHPSAQATGLGHKVPKMVCGLKGRDNQT